MGSLMKHGEILIHLQGFYNKKESLHSTLIEELHSKMAL